MKNCKDFLASTREQKNIPISFGECLKKAYTKERKKKRNAGQRLNHK